MFRNILLPVDFSPKNEKAIEVALDLSQASQASQGSQAALGGSDEAEQSPAAVNLVHVVEVIEHIEFDEMADFYRKLETRATAKLAVLAERFAGTGVRARQDVLFGRRTEMILKHAGDLGSDLIVLSSFRVDRDHPALGLGAISYQVAIVARCPVLLVK
jgi:nucleotide-binding universal stress UspA family protein